ncbi:hypothetical protein [Burkholderia ubonensis]|uniref:hypothetical protein n=1 Tax=Burkholderia ubonensis TaxID=101571 RepID=UPI0012FB8FDB|nr:hypothetical protein [Burkholderia ubonensis]
MSKRNRPSAHPAERDLSTVALHIDMQGGCEASRRGDGRGAFWLPQGRHELVEAAGGVESQAGSEETRGSAWDIPKDNFSGNFRAQEHLF